jgi:predicted amidohydrolase
MTNPSHQPVHPNEHREDAYADPDVPNPPATFPETKGKPCVSSEEPIVAEERRIKLAMGQMLVQGGQPRENLARAVEMIAQAGRQGCQIVVLPECLDLGWAHPAARELAVEIPGPTNGVLCRAAAEAGLYVVAGLTERASGRICNAAVLTDPSGQVLLKHRKINLLGIEQGIYCTGDSRKSIE